MKPHRGLFEAKALADLGPVKRYPFRSHPVAEGLDRLMINTRQVKIRRFVRGCVGRELVPAILVTTLATLELLREGQGGRETPRHNPVGQGEAVVHRGPPRRTAAALHGHAGGGHWCPPAADGEAQERLTRPGPDDRLRAGSDGGEPLHPATVRARLPDLPPPARRQVDHEPDGRKGLGATENRRSIPTASRRAATPAGVEPWASAQPRRASATRIPERFGIDVAAAVLGHAKPMMTARISRIKIRRFVWIELAVGGGVVRYDGDRFRSPGIPNSPRERTETMATRREFLGGVGRGMLVASVGIGTALDLGLIPARAEDDGGQRLRFGGLEPLVGLMQETPVDKLLPMLVGKLASGTELKSLVAAAALANARTFGGEDYIGFHTLMALAPAFHMAREMPADRRALPVLKVLYRNTNRIHEHGGSGSEVLHPVQPGTLSAGQNPGEALREAVRRKDMVEAESTFAAIAAGSPGEAFDSLLVAVEDHTEVHRVVLPYRAWELLDVVGREQAHTMLRQSVRYCVKSEQTQRPGGPNDEVRTLLPRLFDQHHLPGMAPGTKRAGDEWVASMCRTVFEASASSAADAVAAALAEGIDPIDIGEAISLAANQLVLRDAGRPERWASPGKPPGSVHGDSVGVHASDAVNAWRNMARAVNPRNAAACLILAGYEVARDRQSRADEFLRWSPRPLAEFADAVKATAPEALLAEAESAIRSNQQELASALVHRYGTLGHDPAPVFALMLKYAVSEDGALHGEKYYNTVREEFTSTRPAFRWRQLVALSRVTASESGRPAPGMAQAMELLRL